MAAAATLIATKLAQLLCYTTTTKLMLILSSMLPS
jgi:hypothetical protein